jgi:threonine dehydratase
MDTIKFTDGNIEATFGVRTEVLQAESRIRPYIVETPLEYSRYLSRCCDGDVYLKLENIQKSGSFKFRGAANFLLSLGEEEIERGIYTASTGNHAAACAEVLETLGVHGTIFLPENATAAKIDVLRSYDVTLEFHGTDTVVTESLARETARKNNGVFIPPYNHPTIIGGQGTVAVELLRKLENIDSVIIPVGGGGLASGVAGYMKSVSPSTEMIGAQPEHSPVMLESVKAGRVVDMVSLPTLADGTAGGIEPGSITFDICRQCLDDYILVSEQEIAEAIRLILEYHCMLIEGAAALSVACLLKQKKHFKNKRVVLIITGKKITPDKLRSILCT